MTPTQTTGTSVDPVEVQCLLRQLLRQAEAMNGKGASLIEVADAQCILLDVQLDGSRYLLTRCLQQLEPSDVTLSPREREVVRLVAEGLSNKGIALVLDISYWTVSTHVRRIFTKLGVGSRAEMITKVLKEGLLDS